MNRRLLPFTVLSVLTLAACGSDAPPSTTMVAPVSTTAAPSTSPSTAVAARSARDVAVEISERASEVFDRTMDAIDESETPEETRVAAAELLALADELSAATFEGVTVTFSHPQLPWLVEVSGTDGVFCAANMFAYEGDDYDSIIDNSLSMPATEGPCEVLPAGELDLIAAFLSGDPAAFEEVTVNSRVEGARLQAEAVASNVTALVSLELGMDAAADGRTESFWAVTALDLSFSDTDPSVRLLDSTGAPVSDTADLHDRYVLVKSYGDVECTVELTVSATPGETPTITVGDAACA